MKPVFTSGKRKKSNIKLTDIKLNFERGEQIIVSSLSDLMRKENLEKLENFSFGDFSMNVGEFGGSYLFNAVISDQKNLRERFSYLNNNLQIQLREASIISQEEIAVQEGDLLLAENVLSKERRLLDRSVLERFNINSITESSQKSQLLKG